jgi:hypothetical protein
MVEPEEGIRMEDILYYVWLNSTINSRFKVRKMI